jgi:DNA polymerase III epsilon subunit-like protein
MIVVDVEASGTTYDKHSILSVGALEFEHPENRLYLECCIWDGAHVDDDALRVCGFSYDEATDPTKETEAQLVAQFISWADGVEDQTFIGQNVSFDRDFLQAAAQRAGYNWPFAYRTVDTHSVAFMHMVKAGKKVPLKKRHSGLDLDAILNYVGIPEEPHPHNALTGALCHAEVLQRLLCGRKLLPEFSKYELPEYL